MRSGPRRSWSWPVCLALLLVVTVACAGQAVPPAAAATASASREPAAPPPPAVGPTALPPTGSLIATAIPATATPLPTSVLPPSPTPWPTATLLPVIPGETFASTIGQSLALYSENPLVEREPDGQYVNPGAVIFHDGRFHMFANAFRSWPGRTEINYYTSVDGLTWDRVLEAPLLQSTDIAFAPVAALALSGLVTDEGLWVLYFHTFTGNRSPGFIGRATAPVPAGPWTPDREPVLAPGSPGEWDDRQVMRANVLVAEDGYVMIYAGVGTTGESMIGRATSPDGVVWTKHDDPATTDAPFTESDPIMQPRHTWERSWLGRPEVVRNDEGWLMLYEGGANNSFATGLAWSGDGVTWERDVANPILVRDDAPSQFFQGELHYHEGTYYYYLEVGPGPVRTDVLLWTFQAPLRGP